MRITEIAVKNPVGTILMVLAVVVLGLFAIPGIPVSFWPEFVAPSLIVIAPYPGVGPAEIEEQIAKPLEEELSTIDGLDEMESICMDGLCRVIARFKWGVDFDEAKTAVQERTFKARSRFPRETLEPTVLQIQDFLPPGIEIGFNSDQRGLNEIRDLVEEKIKNRLLRLENVAQVQITGGFEQEVVVRVDPDRLSRHNLTLTQINAALMAENMNVPAGKIYSERNTYFIRTLGKYNKVAEIGGTIIAVKNGVPVRLQEVAQVRLENKERTTITRLNGVEVVGVSVREKSGGNTVAMCDEVKEELPRLQVALPADIQVNIIRDQSVFIKNAINSVVRNALLGAVLAAVIIFLFLGNMRNTLIIALSIPISIVATFVLIDFFGLSINTISLGGLALGVGMI
ncbi:efflux RND transporter permease subunit, partial [candidate division KSB1 bacterium]|nr:efflux RND transporter permease subunit [candidate division KSB1 bacterium]